ncbi:replication initiation protein RepC [Rhizobium sp. P38BS-XIX]|uniref:plasmid replication protein RepC n=1 Tax=Rhizobium sp. P38BS-XIX TaxID=2726740 RepID=UPI001456635C|nr:plasmid replication protein RepC [Rhizobium sp. P38BS-XIX]NLR97071.1 replication initiation protein RepC [Rhizobium sp. P38BS-XIX]
MHGENVTTPFGRRTMTLALVKTQIRNSGIRQGKTVDKWKVFRDACDARSLLGVRDRALAVLNALLTFHPETELSDGRNLIVFPSNAQLTARTNGIAGTTLRENLAHLVDAGLIQRCDSPNGKRYARKAMDGSIETAYGFNLRPLLSRSEELALLAQQVAAEQRRLKITKERITIARRDVRKLISAAVNDGAPGEWGKVENIFAELMRRLRSAKTLQSYEVILDELEQLRQDIINRLDVQINSQSSVVNDSEIRWHIKDSNTESIIELEPGFETKQGERPSPVVPRKTEPLKAFPLGMVLRACPEVSMYGPRGNIESWRDLMSAAVVVRSMLGVTPSAYQDACEVMGPENAAATMAAILERTDHISSAGGYLRDLTARARRGGFSLGPVLMALLRARRVEATLA